MPLSAVSVFVVAQSSSEIPEGLMNNPVYGAPSRARNLTSYLYIYGWNFLLGILLLEPCISLIYAWKTNKYTNYLFSLLIMYGSYYMFRHYITIFRERSYAFWEMLNWGAVDRILWMWRVVCSDVVRSSQHAHPQYSIDCSSIEHLSEGTRNAPWRWQCNAETCRSYHT